MVKRNTENKGILRGHKVLCSINQSVIRQ